MLVLTEAAVEVVKSITSNPRAADRAGVRIASSVPEPQEPSALQVAAAPGPGQGDQVIEVSGARVFLEPHAAAYLEDKILDAQTDAEGKTRFSLGAQGSGRGPDGPQ
jgi:Fe-S cluster assembly iron-binding protein IscA